MRVDMHGMPLDGRSPSAETLLHVLIYRLFRRVNVVLHSHSVPAVVLTRLLGDEPLLRLQGYELLKAFRGIKTPDSALERSEEHTSELQSLMRTSYAVFCLKKKSKDERMNTKK